MVMSDSDVKAQMLHRLTAEPRAVVAEVVETHLKNLPHLRIQMAVWLNAGMDPWKFGVDLVEICGNLPGAPLGDFHPVEFPPEGGWPRLRIVLTDVQDLTVDVELSGIETSYAEKIRIALAAKGEEALIFPEAKVSAETDFRTLVNGIV